MSEPLDCLIADIGQEAVNKLISNLGGRRVQVPVRCDPKYSWYDRLAAVLTGDELCALIKVEGGNRITIPKRSATDKAARLARHERAVALRDAGLTVEAIAAEVGYEERYVYRILRWRKGG
jgi:hypothetical protein